MSWALEEWKEGLPTRALQKIQELEGQLDKLKKEKQQRQFQLDSLEAALQKQKQKVEDGKTEGADLKRENQRLMEICETLEKTRQKLSHELQVKESLVNFQESQLSSCKRQIEKLEQELKRCKSEFERSQQVAQLAEVSLNPCSTPQKLFATPLTPSSTYEDLKEKYNKEVEERKRLEAEVKALHAKRASLPASQATMSHRDIARHQASSSVFSWQQEKTPSRPSSCSQKTPLRRDASAAHALGEEVTPNKSSVQTGRGECSSLPDGPQSSQLLHQAKAQNQELKSKMNELELRLQGQEKEMKGQVNKFQELQLQLEKLKVELIEKEKILNKTRDEVVRTTGQYDQAATKCTSLEQKLKNLTEELSCHRQNADIAKRSLEQRIKEKEKELQEELSRQHQSFQALDSEHTQMKNRLTQELQQAKHSLSVLQLELEKVTSVKQQLERSLEEIRHKLSRAEQALQASQITENELRRSSEEMKKENSLIRSQSEQRTREVCHLEEELGKVKMCLSQSQNFAEEMRAKNISQEIMLRDLQEKLNQQENSLTLEKLKLALADLEGQRDCSQDLLKKREHHIEQLNNKLSKIEKEFETLLSALELKKKECEELKEENNQISCCKSESEKLINQVESEKEILLGKINHLESSLKTQQISHERVRTLEMERESLTVEIKNLHSMLDSKMVEIKSQKQAFLELQQKSESSDEKHQKEIENMCLKANKLTGQVESLECKLQILSSEVVTKDQQYQDLHMEYESLRDLLKSRGSSLVTNEDNQRNSEDNQRGSLAFEQQPAVSDSLANLMGEKGSIYSERSNCSVDGDQSSENVAVLQNRVTSLESSLEFQNQMNLDLQKRCEELLQIKGEIEENLINTEQIHQNFVAETNQCIVKLQEDAAVHQNVVAETLATLETKEKELQLLKEKLEAQQSEVQKLNKNNCLLESTLKELQLLSDTLSSEKEEMNSIISLSKKDIEELTQANGALKEVNEALEQEKMNLLQKHETITSCIAEQERSIAELSGQYRQERLQLLQRCEETEAVLEELRGNYKTAQENNAKLECMLSECTALCENRKNELEQLKETFAKEQQEFLTKLAFTEEQNGKLMLELEIEQQTVRSEITTTKKHSMNETESLRQESLTLKEEQNEKQKEVSNLTHENEQLMELTQIKHDCYLEAEPVENPVQVTEDEISKSSSQYQMDIDTKDVSLDNYKAQLVQLEALLRNMEVKLDQSEEEKNSLHQELQTLREVLESKNSQVTRSQARIGLKDCEIAEEKYVSMLQELSTSQNENAHLQCSLQTAMNKLTELGKMCEVLRVEKLQLESELNDSRSECITATSQMTAEVEKLVNEMKMLNHESALTQSELMKDTSDVEFHDKPNHTSMFLTPLDSSNFCEQMALSNKEVRVHFAELQEKFSCLQSEHKILHDQHCEVSSKMSALRSYVDTLKAENSVLSMSLRTLQGDLVKEKEPGAEDEHILPLSFCGTDSPSLTNLGETSFYKDVLEQTGDTSNLSLEGNASANPSDVDVSYSSLQEENPTEKESPPTSVRTVEELEILCQMYLQSLKNLEEKIESQRITKTKEIEELEQLLSCERKELSCLRKQYLSEKGQWQQKLTSVTLEMESKLLEEKQQTKTLSLELEVAQLQLQELDLGTRSLLGSDLESAVRGQNNSYDIKESEVYISETKEKTPKQDADQTCDKDVQQDLCLETSVTETETTTLTGEGCEEQPLKTNCEALAEDKTQDYSECISELFSSPNVLVPMDVLEDQGSIQSLHLQKDISNENLRLLSEVEDWDKKVENLLNEIKEADSKLSLQEIQLKIKIATCIQLEKIIKDLKEEKTDLSEKLESLPCNQEVCPRVERSEDLVFNLDMVANELSKSTKDNAANKENNYKEKILDMERELTRIKSEKANIEHHIISVEANLEVVQADKLCLERDTESKQKVIVDLKEELFTVISERNRLREKLDNMSKENKALEQMSEKMKEKIEELESDQSESLRHIGAVESEIKDKADLVQTLSFNVGELTKDKAHLQEQLQNLQNNSQELSLAVGELEIQIGQLNKEKESLVKESQNFQVKLTELECEKQTISKALEMALKEKGEFAVQLSSTQEEVHQLRRGIEKLSVRIEADEKKHLSAVAKLKESQRESDSLKDKVENLERELEMSEENQELAILDSENLKAEVETLNAQKDEIAKSLSVLELDLVTVRSERENLAKQLQEKQSRVSELDELCSSLRSLLEEKEQARVQMEGDSKSAMLRLQLQLKELREEVAALCNDQETLKAQEQSLDQPGEEVHHLKSSIQKLKVHIDADEKKQRHILEQLKESKHYADLLKDRVENLEQELMLSEKNKEHMIFQAENSKAEIQTLKSDIQRMAQNLQDLKLELISTRSENEKLMKEFKKEQEQVSKLETINSSIENLLKDKEQEKVQMEEETKITVEMLQTQLKELKETVVSLCNDQEAHKTKEQNLGSQVQTLELEKAQLLQDLGEAKNKYIIFQSSVNALTQEVEAGKQKLEKEEEEVRTLKEQLKDRELLVCKLAQVEGEQQLWQKQKQELRNLTMELEQKAQVLQSKNDMLQTTYEALQNSHKSLENELGLIKMERTALVERVSTMAEKEAELQRELRDVVPKDEYEKEKSRLTEELGVLVEELKNTKVAHLKYVNQLEKDFQRAQGKIKLLLKSCKQLEGEKKMLQKEFSQLEAAQKQRADELMTENKELKETLEEKIKETDKYLDKYCSLLISHEELEKTKEMLEIQVALLNSRQSKQDLQSSPLLKSSVPGPSQNTSASEKKSTSSQNKASGKRQRSSGIWENGNGAIPSTPGTFSKKSRKSVSSSTHPAEDEEETEFEPEGLPEVVKKGFADIPTGKTSPYILRRTTMATRTSPRLAAQKLVGSSLTLGKENVESSKPTAGGSRSQKVKVVQESSADSHTAFQELPGKSLIASNIPGRNSTESSREGLRAKRAYPASSSAAGPDPMNNENCRVQ
ncbi:centromere protein F [Apodemus sylvaticus]|uniref:centromere protein F n=1 Tax=Apodemus sylvaticus TaxID=10129 RepID=UPI002241F14C|nr:centromere protein F [Apodemus sylvaticus]XP_052055773.1 centromere protein F [Apodemus sylvaticus]